MHSFIPERERQGDSRESNPLNVRGKGTYVNQTSQT